MFYKWWQTADRSRRSRFPPPRSQPVWTAWRLSSGSLGGSLPMQGEDNLSGSLMLWTVSVPLIIWIKIWKRRRLFPRRSRSPAVRPVLRTNLISRIRVRRYVRTADFSFVGSYLVFLPKYKYLNTWTVILKQHFYYSSTDLAWQEIDITCAVSYFFALQPCSWKKFII